MGGAHLVRRMRYRTQYLRRRFGYLPTRIVLVVPIGNDGFSEETSRIGDVRSFADGERPRQRALRAGAHRDVGRSRARGGATRSWGGCARGRGLPAPVERPRRCERPRGARAPLRRRRRAPPRCDGSRRTTPLRKGRARAAGLGRARLAAAGLRARRARRKAAGPRRNADTRAARRARSPEADRPRRRRRSGRRGGRSRRRR